MRNRLIRFALLLPAALSLGGTVAPTLGRACGPYGGRGSGEHDVVVHVLANRAPSAGVSVRARCGDEQVFASPREDGGFVLRGLSGRACQVEAVGFEVDGHARHVTRRVRLPRERVVLSLPDRAPRLA